MKYIINLLKQTFRMTLNMHLRSTNQIHMDLKNHRHLDNYQTSRGRGRQFNLTPFNLYIKTLLASKRNQIYSEASSTRFSAINLLYLHYRWNSSRRYIKSQTFPDHQTSRGTQFNWHFSIYISEHFTPLNAMKYIINLLKQTFRMTLNINLRSTNQIHMDLKNHRHFGQLSDFLWSRKTIQFNTFQFIYQNTSRI